MNGLAGALTGFILGFVIQRGRFDMAAGFQAFQIRRESEQVKAWSLAIIVQAMLIFFLVRLGGIQVVDRPFYWLAATIGGLIFGAGTALAGSGAATIWSRAGQGMVDAFVTVLGFAIGAATAMTGAASGLVAALQEIRIERFTTIHGLFGITFGTALSYGVLLWAWWFSLTYKRECACAVPPTQVSDLRNLFPGLRGQKLTPSLVYQLLFRRPWSWMATGASIGLAAGLAWLTASYSTGGGLEVTTGTAGILQFLVNGTKVVPWSVSLVLGIGAGACVAATVARERWLSGTTPRALLNSLVGGFLMGLGGTMAMGDDVAASLTGMALFSLNGVVTTVAIFVGARVTHLVWGELTVIRVPDDEKTIK